MQLKLITTLCLFTFLVGCIPTVTRVYQTPKVEGVLVDSTTEAPISGLQVFHENVQEKAVQTDKNGSFTLPSISNIQGSAIMAGHALKVYKINILSDDYSQCIEVIASFKMHREETSNIGTLLLDKGATPTCIHIEPKPQD